MKNTPMPLGTYVEVRHATVIHTDVEVIIVRSIGEAKCFNFFIVEASGHVRAFQM